MTQELIAGLTTASVTKDAIVSRVVGTLPRFTDMVRVHERRKELFEF